MVLSVIAKIYHLTAKFLITFIHRKQGSIILNQFFFNLTGNVGTGTTKILIKHPYRNTAKIYVKIIVFFSTFC